MADSIFPYHYGYQYELTVTTAAGALSISRYTEFNVDETPVKKDNNVCKSRDDESGFIRKKLKLTFKGLRGLTNTYSSLPPVMERVTAVTVVLLDEDGTPVADNPDFGPIVFNSETNPAGYKNLAVTEKRGKQDDGAGDFELVIESGVANAKVTEVDEGG